MQRRPPAAHGPARGGVPLSRRAVLGAPLAVMSCTRSPPSSIGFASTGGAYNDILHKVWIDDFEKQTGIKVNLSSNTSLTQTELQVATDRPQWDVVELTGPWYVLAVRQGLLLPLDTDIVDRKAMPAECFRPYGVEYAMFNDCMAWDRRVIPDRLQPANWADFWDTARRPGRRSLGTVNAGGGTLEMALMADGVAPDRLYPLDLDRAFRSLERLGANNIVWSQSFVEPVQRLVSQEVSMASTWPFRVMNANSGGANLGFSCNQCSVGGDWLGVVRTSRNPQAAFRLINALIGNTRACAEFSRLTHYGTPNLDSLKLIPKEDADLVPTSPALAAKLHGSDDVWWADNLVPVAQRFKRWQLGLAA